MLRMFPKGPVKTQDVFGIHSGTNPLSYIVRDVEVAFREALENPAYEAVVVYGMSKQGKSSLLRNALRSGARTFASAGAGNTREALYREILSQVRTVDKRTTESSSAETSTWGIRTPSLTPGLGLSASQKLDTGRAVSESEVVPDYSLASTVARRYRDAAGAIPIVIDNFHFVSAGVQRELATDIRAFGERGIKIVILGTWRAHNHLQLLNSDLASRVKTISIEPWTENDLLRVLEAGERLLNISFSPSIKAALTRKSAGIVGLLQRATQDYLLRMNVRRRLWRKSVISDLPKLTQVFDEIAEELLEETIGKFRAIASIGEPWVAHKTRMHWVIRAFVGEQSAVNADGVEFSRLATRIAESIKPYYDGELFASKQIKPLLGATLLREQQRKFRTPILSYDAPSGRLSVIDGWALFTLRRRREEILDAIG